MHTYVEFMSFYLYKTAVVHMAVLISVELEIMRPMPAVQAAML